MAKLTLPRSPQQRGKKPVRPKPQRLGVVKRTNWCPASELSSICPIPATQQFWLRFTWTETAGMGVKSPHGHTFVGAHPRENDHWASEGHCTEKLASQFQETCMSPENTAGDTTTEALRTNQGTPLLVSAWRRRRKGATPWAMRANRSEYTLFWQYLRESVSSVFYFKDIQVFK